jgi:hypothetical protein
MLQYVLLLLSNGNETNNYTNTKTVSRQQSANNNTAIVFPVRYVQMASHPPVECVITNANQKKRGLLCGRCRDVTIRATSESDIEELVVELFIKPL